ncbi:MAG TPA: DUF308 domain-containing protein [Rectinema sp.]|jgi:uncharacterized membrane protein HdeD (DUF308 family)|nr:DUF308 domain-containing protein [Rectinema sp.]HNT59981.1 DUF308 domain-containing protein [Rectinema sp.]HOC27582.1 DUF308 domain-containing protein [Rectinema sp.]HOE75805.1 DUF308 domain-containing protein [Rectinema sp.]HOH17061.1 DUF308 domain-containing protein [Rectinema sp.]
MKKTDWPMLVVGMILFVGGILALVNPGGTFTALEIMLGIVALFEGIVLVFKYYKIKKYTGFRAKAGAWFGVALAVLGVLLALWPAGMATIFTYFIALWFIVDSARDLVISWPIRRLSTSLYVTTLVLNILVIVGGLILLFNPHIMQKTMGVIIGISLLLSGAWCVIFALNSKIEA